ncbi:MAG: pilus assembly protein CpaB [Acidimicrobiaceae bacterium]|jgi:Flp pilus assembly protein CpaB
MEAATTKQNPMDGLRRFLGTRRGSFLVAAIAAALAAAALAVYLNNYKDDVRGGTLPTQVLIADRLIPKGTSGDAVAADRLFRPTTIAEDAVKPLALTNAAVLSGKAATHDIFPGQQITSADFSSDADPLRGRLTGTQRALAIPIDTAHGLIGSLRTGDHVDVYASFTGGGSSAGRGVLRTIAQGVLVLKAPSGSKIGKNVDDQEAVILRLTDTQSARMAYAADNGKLWFALRPPTSSESSAAPTVTEQSVAGGRVSSLPKGTP